MPIQHGLLVVSVVAVMACDQPQSAPPPSATGTSEALRLLPRHWPWPLRHHHHHPHKPWREPQCAPTTQPTSCGWQAYDRGLSGAAGYVRFDPRAPGVVYAASGGKMWQSADGGETWHQQGLLDSGVTDLDFPGSDAADLLAATHTGLQQSHDAGATWSPLALHGLGVGPIASAPSQPLQVYAAVNSNVLLTSIDGGFGWDASGYGYPHGITYGLSVDPEDARTVLAAVRGTAPGGTQLAEAAIVRSTDGGATWSSVYSGGGWILGLTRCPANPSVLAAPTQHGVVRSGDGGATWQLTPIDVGSNGTYGVVFNPQSCEEFYALQGVVGPLRTSDGGQTFSAPLIDGIDVDVAGDFPGSMAIDPADPQHLIVANHSGFFASHDRGEHWTRIPAMTNLTVASLVVSPRAPSQVWMATYGSGVWTRADASSPWQQISHDRLTADYAVQVGLDPFPTGRVLVGADGTMFFAADGQQFQPTGIQGMASALAFDPIDPRVMYAGTQVLGFFKSSDGGATWLASNGDLQPWSLPPQAEIDVRAIAIDPDRSNRLFATTNGGGVLRSEDAGASWQRVLPAQQLSECLLFIPGGDGELYVCLGGVQHSSDGGDTWNDASAGLTTLAVNQIVHDDETGALYAATGDGVFSLQPGAAEWTALENDCLQSAREAAIVSDVNGRTLIVGAAGSVYAHAL
jgi:photosystem II stability/assembly factor-like uncharacterized protein